MINSIVRIRRSLKRLYQFSRMSIQNYQRDNRRCSTVPPN